MPKRTTKPRKKTDAKPAELAVVAYAEDEEQAREYESLLKADDIPVTISENTGSDEHGRTVAIMVPEDYVDEASVIVESQNIYDDLYEFGMDEEDEFTDDDDDFPEDIF